jgi:hypothetical protein
VGFLAFAAWAWLVLPSTTVNKAGDFLGVDVECRIYDIYTRQMAGK